MSRKYKKLAALFLAAMMTLAMGLSVFAAGQTKCVDQDTIDKVVFDTKYILENKIVKIDCINEKVNHPDVSYWGALGGFYVGKVYVSDAGYACDVTVAPEVYVAMYNRQIGVKHVLEPSTQGAQKITFVFNMKRGIWELQSKLPVVYTVICDCGSETETETPETEETTVPGTEETETPETEETTTPGTEETETPETEETTTPGTEETETPETDVETPGTEEETPGTEEETPGTDVEEETEDEKAVPSEDGSKPGSDSTVEKVDTPYTGDMAPVAYFVTIMAICMALAGAVAVAKKRQR